MRKLVGMLFVAAAATLVALSAPNTLAQGKKAKTGTIEIIESKDGKFRFSVRDADGKYLGGYSVGLPTEKAAKETVEELKKVLATATYVNKKSEEPKKDKDK